MYKIAIFILCCVQYVLCTTNCTAAQLGAEVPASACDKSLCKTVTVDALNQIRNYKVLATTWNYARAVLVSPQCTDIYNFDATVNGKKLDMTLNITIKYGIDCSETTYYPLTFTSEAVGYGTPTGWTIFETEDGGDIWELCFPYLSEGNFIYRRCRTNPPPPAGKGYATIYVYEVAGGPREKSDIIDAANSLGVQWDKTTVDCL